MIQVLIGSPDLYAALSYAVTSGKVESFTWGTEVQFVLKLFVQRCRVLPDREKRSPYYMFKEHWVRIEKLLVCVRSV